MHLSSCKVRSEKKEAIAAQKNPKLEKNKIVKDKKNEGASKKYTNKHYYHEQYMSGCCWRIVN